MTVTTWIKKMFAPMMCLLCIQTGKMVTDSERLKFRTDQLYFKSPQEMFDFFAEYPGALENTVRIAERCNVTFDFKTYHFPKFDAPEEKAKPSFLTSACKRGSSG